MDCIRVCRIRVPFGDIDMLGHVNNAAYLHYLENARLSFWDEQFGLDGFERMPYVLGEVRVRYLRPARIRDELDVCVRVSAVGRKSFTLEYRIVDVASGAAIAEASTIQVMYDWRNDRSYEVPEEVRLRFAALGFTPPASGTSTGC